MADIIVKKKKSPNLFLLWWSAEQGQWKTERSKVWHSSLIPTLIGLVGPPVCKWQNSRNYPTISVLAGSAGDPANSLHPTESLNFWLSLPELGYLQRTTQEHTS